MLGCGESPRLGGEARETTIQEPEPAAIEPTANRFNPVTNPLDAECAECETVQTITGAEDSGTTIQTVLSAGLDDKSGENENFCHAFFGWMGLLNANHFGSQSTENYLRYHGIALEQASKARALYEALNEMGSNELNAHFDFVRELEYEALSFEGVAQHFFQDRWASGHMWERWGGPDWPSQELGVVNITTLGPLVHASALTGFIHGHESFSITPNLLSSPGLTGVPMLWGDSMQGPLFQGMGDYRYSNLLVSTFTPLASETVQLDNKS